MDNPYWKSDGQEHYVNLNTVKLLCFELANIFEASNTLYHGMTAADYADKEALRIDDFPLVKLHQDLAFQRSSELLLQLSVLIRTYDDQMKGAEASEKYRSFSKGNDTGDYIGTLQGKDKFYLREACNKIIHAREIRPLYERADNYVFESNDKEVGQDVWYLTGEVELSGKHREKIWDAELHVQAFLEVILGQIEFGLPSNQ